MSYDINFDEPMLKLAELHRLEGSMTLDPHLVEMVATQEADNIKRFKGINRKDRRAKAAKFRKR